MFFHPGVLVREAHVEAAVMTPTNTVWYLSIDGDQKMLGREPLTGETLCDGEREAVLRTGGYEEQPVRPTAGSTII